MSRDSWKGEGELSTAEVTLDTPSELRGHIDDTKEECS